MALAGQGAKVAPTLADSDSNSDIDRRTRLAPTPDHGGGGEGASGVRDKETEAAGDAGDAGAAQAKSIHEVSELRYNMHDYQDEQEDGLDGTMRVLGGPADEEKLAVHSSGPLLSGRPSINLSTLGKQKRDELLEAFSQSSDSVEKFSIRVIVIVTTVLMASIESNSKSMVVAFLVSLGLIFGVNVWIASAGAWWATALYLGLSLLVGAAILHSFDRVEEAEKFVVLFDEAFTESTKGIPAGSDQFGPRQFENPTLVQSGSQTMEEYMADAERLYERFVLEVVDELAQATSPLSEPVPTIAGLKKLKRTTEKIRKEYNGLPEMVKDYLRACIICKTMVEVCRACDALKTLQEQGLVEIMQIKNRFRGKRTSTGYRDININVKFGGHVCEIQVQLASILMVKKGAHRVYTLLRSIDLDEVTEVEPIQWKDLADACSTKKRVTLGMLRYFTAGLATLISAGYMIAGISATFDIGSFGEMTFGRFDLPGLVLGAVLAPPFGMIAVLTLRDFFRQVNTTHPKTSFRIKIASVTLMWLVFGLFVGLFTTNRAASGGPFILAFTLLCWTPPIFICAWRMTPADDATMVRSRMAVMYERYLGLHGSHYALKVQVVQLFAVLLQSSSKIPFLACFVSVRPRISPIADLGTVEYTGDMGRNSAYNFWFFFSCIVVNALYPGILLTSKDVRMSRNGVAVVDVLLDMAYSYAYWGTMVRALILQAAFPVYLEQVVSLFMPLSHIMLVCNTVEVAAVDVKKRVRRHHSRMREDPSAQDRRESSATSVALTGRTQEALPAWQGVRFCVVALAIITAVLLLECRDRFPLGTIPGTCAPCVCDEEGVLLGCPYHVEIGDPILWISGRGVTAFERGWLKGNEGAIVIHLEDNEVAQVPEWTFEAGQKEFGAIIGIFLHNNQIERLPRDLFDSASNLKFLTLHDNRVSEIELGLFSKLNSLAGLSLARNKLVGDVTSETFRGLDSLVALELSQNNLTSVQAGAFHDLKELRFLSLGYNELQVDSVEAGAFGLSLDHIWLTANDKNVTCARLVGVLPTGSKCTDGKEVCQAQYGIAALGNGFCDKMADTEVCLWDGGDC